MNDGNTAQALEGVVPAPSWEPPSTDERPLVWAFERARDAWEYLSARLFLGFVHIAILLFAAVVIFPDFLLWTLTRDMTNAPAPPVHHACIVVFLGALVPPGLARLCYLLINHRAARRPISFGLPANTEPWAFEKVMRTWAYELERACWSLSRAEFFASMWGLVATFTLLASVAFLRPALRADSTPQAAQELIALAVTMAMVVRLLLDFSKICVRTAGDDASKRMFAEALKSLILSVVSTAAIMLLAPVIGPEGLRPTTSSSAVGLGAATAILGVPAFEYVRRRVEQWLGAERAETAPLLPLSSLAGLSASEIERLSDEGIDSVEALVNTPIPRMFLATRFSLQRLCDWYDRGLLLCRLGVNAAADLKARTGIAGALSLKDLCTHSPVLAVSALKKAMRLETDDEATAVVRALTTDASVTLLRTVSQTHFIATKSQRHH